MVSSIAHVCLLLAIGVASTLAGQCPDNPSQAMQKCAESLTLDLQAAQGHLFVTNAEYTKKMCEGDDVNTVITCMETIYNDCTGEAGYVDKDMLAKPEAWKAGLKQICDNRKFLTDNADCVKTGLTERQTCIREYEKKAAADTQLKKINLATENKDGQREMFQIVCQLTENLMQCFDKTLIKDCPKKMETIIDSVIHKFLPPICHPAVTANTDSKGSYATVEDTKTPDNNGAVTISFAVSMVISVLLCLLI